MSDFILPPPPFMTIKNQPTAARAALEAAAEDKTFKRVFDIAVFRCECVRCGYAWHTLQQSKPKSCARKECHSAYWDRPKSKIPTKVSQKVKHAARNVSADGPDGGLQAADEAIPDIPVGLLEAVGELASAGAGDTGGVEAGRDGGADGQAQGSGGAPVPSGAANQGDPGVSPGQPHDGGVGANPANTAGDAEEETKEEDLSGADEFLRSMDTTERMSEDT